MNFETHTYQFVTAVLGGRGSPAETKERIPTPILNPYPHPPVVTNHSRHQLPEIINPGFVENAKLSF